MQGGGSGIELLSISCLAPRGELRRAGAPDREKESATLVCYLATKGEKSPRRELAELLWPKSDERPARTDLRSILTKLRKAVGKMGKVSPEHIRTDSTMTCSR
jgi:DNA-binding SARP family transcriptional activator